MSAKKQNKKKSKKKQNKGKTIEFKQFAKKVVQHVKRSKAKNINDAILAAVQVLRREKRKIKKPPKGRIIPIPKKGGFLSTVLPIATAVLGAIPTIKSFISNLFGNKQKVMDDKSGSSVQVAKGLFLKPYKKGMGLVFM